jgi:signal transduction histidine kinase
MAAVHDIHAASSEAASAAPVPPEILESWERSRAAGLDPERPGFHRVPEDDLRARLRAHRRLLETAEPHLPWVSAFLGDIPHVVLIADTTGIVLHSIGSEDMRQRWCLMPGCDWSEARMGTNGVGTALTMGAPVAVVGDQHYCKEFATVTCLAAPIVVEGKLMGVIDLSISVEYANPRFLYLISHTAQVISQHMLAEVALERADLFSGRLRRLHDLARALARTLSRSEIAEVVVEHALHSLDASTAVGYVLEETKTGERLRCLTGRALPDGLRGQFEILPLDNPLPMAVAAATGKPVHAPTRAATEAEFPALAAVLPPDLLQSFVALPLRIDGRSIGGIAFSFPEPRELDPEDREYLLTMADHFAVALDRVTKFERARVAREAAERARLELEQAEQVRERLLGMIGHDLRSPLSAVIVAAERLCMEPCSHRHERIGERMASSAARMTRMIAQLLDFTRARLGGGIPIQPVMADLGAICRRVVDEILMAHPGAQVQASLAAPACGQWDPDRLADVVSNLLGNTIDHGAAGTPIEVTLEEHDVDVTLQVRNQGATIAATELRSIFDPFHRGRVTSHGTGKRAGLGLGLYIVQQIVAAHGGTVHAESHEGVTTFTVVLPKAAPASPPAA